VLVRVSLVQPRAGGGEQGIARQKGDGRKKSRGCNALPAVLVTMVAAVSGLDEISFKAPFWTAIGPQPIAIG
jgi:hypothetical protein